MRKLKIAGLLALFTTVLFGCAQYEPLPPPQESVEKSSKPGKVSVVKTAKVTAAVTAIDSDTRTLTLKGPKGKTFNVVAGDDVRNFAQIKVNDWVVVRYVQAISMDLRKNTAGYRKGEASQEVVRAPKGDKPGVAVGREVTIVADVIGVNRKAKTITLKGPRGKVVTLDVQNPEQFKVVKVGDQVEVDYVEAVAISVEPAKKKAAKK